MACEVSIRAVFAFEVELPGAYMFWPHTQWNTRRIDASGFRRRQMPMQMFAQDLSLFTAMSSEMIIREL